MLIFPETEENRKKNVKEIQSIGQIRFWALSYAFLFLRFCCVLWKEQNNEQYKAMISGSTWTESTLLWKISGNVHCIRVTYGRMDRAEFCTGQSKNGFIQKTLRYHASENWYSISFSWRLSNVLIISFQEVKCFSNYTNEMSIKLNSEKSGFFRSL